MEKRQDQPDNSDHRAKPNETPPGLKENVLGGYDNRASGKVEDNPHSNKNAVEHALVGGDAQPNRNSGKEAGLVNPPLQSLNPTSQTSDKTNKWPDKKNFKNIDHISFQLGTGERSEFKYPFADMKIGSGVFVSVEEGTTTDKLMSTIHQQVFSYRQQNSDVEKDENGDDVWESVVIQTKKRNDDGTIQLDNGKPRVGANQTNRPKLIGPNFVVKAIVKDDELSNGNKASGDGVLIVRVG